jgi:hypothetical protein
MRRAGLVLLALLCGLVALAPQAKAQRQLPDMEFSYVNASPAWPAGGGPEILLSTRESGFVERGSLDPLARLAETDGFKVSRIDGPLTGPFDGTILVIANPFLESFKEYPAMTPPSAFSPEEIEAVRKWVEGGGSLLLLADHAPLGGGSSDLAKAFGFEFLNGHTAQTAAADSGDRRVVITFTPDNGLASESPLTDGSTGREKVARFQAFGGQSFIPPADARPVLTIPQGWSAIFTYRLEREIRTAPRIDASGMSQGATLEYGKGRVAVFAEAGGFTAQIIDGEEKFGFNTPEGAGNPEFILATLRWLARFSPSAQ